MKKENTPNTRNIRKHLLTIVIVFTTLVTYGQTGGKFYATLADFENQKPINGYVVKEGSYGYAMFAGEGFKVFKDGNKKAKGMKVRKFPSSIFTYNRSGSDLYLMKVYKKRSYIVLSYGKLCYYAMYASQGKRYISETIDGKRKKFSKKVLEKYLAQYNLLDSYEKDRPKREFQDNVNEYYNKVINWQIKYFDLLNEKMK